VASTRTSTFDIFRAHALKFTLLKHAEQLGLHVERHIAHLVQEQCAVVRLLETADPVVSGSRESAPDVPEQLRFEQFSGSALQLTATIAKWLRLPAA